MIAYLGGSGFLSTRGTIGADLSLVVMLAAAVMLTVGVVFARSKQYEAHRWIQTAAVCLNAIPVVAWMIRSLVVNILPGLPGDLGQGSYVLATVHAVVGAIGVALGVFIVIRANQLEARGESLSRYRNAMRIAYVVYMLGVVLGSALYFVNYG